MPFTADDVRRLARAQRLSLGAEEESAIARDLERILDAFGTLDAEPSDAPLAAPAPPRPDEVRPSPFAADMLANAVRTPDGRVRVPRRTGP